MRWSEKIDVFGNHQLDSRRPTDMIRSRHLALATAVVALGLASCGDPSTTAPVANKPQVINLASGGPSARNGGMAPAAATADASTESKIAFMGRTDFVYDGQLPALDGPAASWFFAPGQKADTNRIAKIAASLGVVGDVRSLPQEQGGGWAVGPEDYSAAVLTVGSDGMLNWYLSAAPTTSVGYACADSGVISAGTTSSGGGVAQVAPSGTVVAETVPAPDVPVTEPGGPATDVAVPDCPTPVPPVGVPTKDEALAKAKALFADWGYDVNSFQFDEPYADQWGANVNASLLLDGMKAPVILSVGFGENAGITYASGYLADPQRGADYPTIGATAGLERLNTQQNQYVTMQGGVAMGAADGVAATTDGISATGVATRMPIEPGIGIAPCEPEATSNNCAPVNVDPIKVTLNSVKTDLTMVWAADNTVWLLPAYTFGTADGGLYSVIAVEDAYLHQPDPVAVPTGSVQDPGAVPVTVVAVGAPSTTPPADPTATAATPAP
ncbi:MAG: hypothetical protein QOE09_3415 [Ilumatobacteraceae bacterium]|jgi:hypothetical protein